MVRRGLFGLVVGAAVLAGATLAQAASKHEFSVTATESAISESANYPNPGSVVVQAGMLTGTFGDGAIVEKYHITGHPTPSTFSFRGTTTAFYALGTLRSTSTGTATLMTNGSVRLEGHAHYTGGTGAYRGARGRYSFTATVPPPAPNRPEPAIGHVSGTVFY